MNNKCRKCLFRQSCRRNGIRPVIGECTITDNLRGILLKEIRRHLGKADSLTLSQTVCVTADFMGDGFSHLTRRIEKLSGSDPLSLEFSVGKDEYGNDVLTSQLDENDLKQILTAL